MPHSVSYEPKQSASSNVVNSDISTDTKTPQRSDSMSQPTPTLPKPAASPDEVRLFMSYLLREQGIPQSDAQDVAAQWKIGRGREMGTYDPTIYFEIFGAEYGWILYREIKLRIHEEKCRRFTYKYSTGESAFEQNMILSGFGAS